MDATLEKIDNSIITAYVERCSRFRENVNRLQEQIHNFKAQIFGDVDEQHVTQEKTFDAQSIIESASTIAPQPSTSAERIMPADIDIDALVNDITTNANDLEI